MWLAGKPCPHLAHGWKGAKLASRPNSRRIVPSHFFSISAPSCERKAGATDHHVDITELLSKPTWSVASLLPPEDQPPKSTEITSKQLHHLLRLSALPPPKDTEEEAMMQSTLSSQLHFVKEIQKVDTTGVEPLQSLRDETKQGEKEAELDMEALKDALAQEEVRGKHHKRIRRRRDLAENKDSQWDPLATAGKKVGRFFVVEGGKEP